MLSKGSDELILYARRVEDVKRWLRSVGFPGKCKVQNYESYGNLEHDVVINFVGVGDPARALAMGASIFNITNRYDEMVLNELKVNPKRRYIFMSSGAVYGSDFQEPANINTMAITNINSLQPQNYYSLAKLYTEGRHRSMTEYNIVDLRIFNYFSRTADIKSRFFITDLITAVKNNVIFKTSSEDMIRDYLHPKDLVQLITKVLKGPPSNIGLDCYTKNSISKSEILNLFESRYGLQVEISKESKILNSTGLKSNYFSVNFKAGDYGYKPEFSSYDGLVDSLDAMLIENIV